MSTLMQRRIVTVHVNRYTRFLVFRRIKFAITTFKVIQGHLSKARIGLPISVSYKLTLYLAAVSRYHELLTGRTDREPETEAHTL